MRLAAPDADTKLVDALAPHLRAELNARDIGVCVGAPPAADATAIAEIVLRDDAGSLTISIRDLVTDKRVERVLDLASLPADTRLLAVATSIDELLRASWLETLLATPQRATPVPVTRAVQESLPAPPSPRAAPAPRRVHGEIGASVMQMILPGLRNAVGFEATGTLWATHRFGGYVRGGFTHGAKEESLNGTIGSDALHGGLGAFVGLVQAERRIGVRVEGGLDAMRVSFRADALDGASARATPSLFALDASLGLRSWFDFGPVRGLIGLSGHYAVVPAVGTDQTVQGVKSEITGIKGFGIEASFGAAWAF